MKCLKFSLVLLATLSMSGCDDNTAINETLTDSLGSAKTSVAGGFSAIPETLSIYANAPDTYAELLATKKQLAVSNSALAAARKKLQAGNAAQTEALNRERAKLRQELRSITVTSHQVQKLKQQLMGQNNRLNQLQQMLSRTEASVRAASQGKQRKKSKK